ncbi:unnamed protein product [Pneumocystis jirovecii]|uniref:Uncharacterized protein n=1 Tax=Pneumocystis jirovecii TaxID=42068 RepID=L0PCD6_PNEJI|nr:unnamed protein product [Pneumocystis jirovecii]
MCFCFEDNHIKLLLRMDLTTVPPIYFIPCLSNSFSTPSSPRIAAEYDELNISFYNIVSEHNLNTLNY